MSSLLNVLGRSRLPALLAFPLAYSLPLNYGFISFAFSLPVVVVFLAQLGRLLLAPPPIGRRRRRRRRWRCCCSSATCRTSSMAACAAGAYALFSAVPWRRRLVAVTTVLPSLAALLWWQRHLRPDFLHRPRGLAFAWNTVKSLRLRELPRGPHPWLADLKARIAIIPLNTLRGFSDGIEVKAANALLLLIGVYFLVGLCGRLLLPGTSRGQPRMRISAWVAFLGAFAAYFLLPHHLNEFDIVTFFPRFAPLVVPSRTTSSPRTGSR